MPKRPAHQRVKKHEVYSLAEAAEVVGVHRQTVARWVRTGGLVADRSRKPWLIRGADFKQWLIKRRQAAKVPLADGFMHCLPCRAPRRPDGAMADYRPRTETIGLWLASAPPVGG